jgi:protein-S-isoprenylcysteine O-methyltransferase Ste14
MKKLELKIPPVAFLIFFAFSMWLSARFFPTSQMEFLGRLNLYFSITFAVIGMVILLIAIWEFKKAKTTILPMNPEHTIRLITSGIFKFSRNPIYLGLLTFLVSWGFYLSSLISFLSIGFFIFCLNSLQIVPEERMLEKIFGATYLNYKSRVRRWI